MGAHPPDTPRPPDGNEWLEATGELRLPRILDSNSIGIVLADFQGRIFDTNEAFLRIVGYDREAVSAGQLNFLNLTPPELRHQDEAAMAAMKQTGKHAPFEKEFIRRDGSRVPVMVSTAYLGNTPARGDVGIGFIIDQTERRQAEQALRERETQLRIVLDHAAVLVARCDRQGRYRFVNRGYAERFGLTPDDFAGKSLSEMLGSEAYALVRPYVDAALSGKRVEFELQVPYKDIGLRVMHCVYEPERDTTGEVDGLVAVVTDVTEQHGAQLALRESQRQLKSVLTNLPGMAYRCRTTPPWNLTFASEGVFDLTGRTADEFMSGALAWADIMHPSDREGVASEVDASLRERRMFELTYRIVHRSGEIRWVLDRGRAVYNENDEPIAFEGYVGDLTRQKMAEQAVRDSERMYRAIGESIDYGVWVCDPEGRNVYASESFLRLVGLTQQQCSEFGWGDVLHPEDADRTIAAWKECVRAMGVWDIQHRFRGVDGQYHPVLARGVPVKDDQGRVICWAGINLDISRLKRAEEAARFQAELLDAVNQAAIATDGAGTILYWNRFAETMYGWTKDEALGRNIIEVVVPPEHIEEAQAIIDVLRTGKSWSGEFLVRRRDGTVFPAYVTDTPILDHEGKIQTIIGISVDISERKHAEETWRFLAEASATLAALVDYQSTLQKVASLAVPRFADWCAVDILEPSGSMRRLAVAHIDPGKRRLAQELDERYPPDPDVPYGTYHVLRTGQSEMAEDIADSLLVEVARDAEHLRILRDLGLKSYMCVPLQTRDRIAGVLTFVTAESARRYTKADLQFAEELARRAAIAIENCQLYAYLREADRLKDGFLAMLAHELRNPLAPIRNALHVMRLPGAEPSVVSRARDMAERQVQHMARLLDDLLDVSRISRGRIELRTESVDLSAVVHSAVEATRSQIEDRRHRLHISLPPEMLRVEGDPTRLEQILTNLLNNAAKYTDPGGQIWLSVEREQGQAVVRVRDSGIGIAPEMLPRIFDLFVQAERRLDRSQGGVGIGLTLVRKLAEMHGGSIEATSEGVGRGSEFVLRLPAIIASHNAAPARTAAVQLTAPKTPRRVLVVDDNVDAADSLAMLLQLAGLDVRTAYDGVTALNTARSFEPHLVFLDIGMPGMDGYEVARRLRQSQLPLTLVALTGWGQQEDRKRSKDAGFDHHLVKPVELHQLQELLV